MGYLPKNAVWKDGVYQYETTDPLQSGPGAIDNWQGQDLADRTEYLKEGLEAEVANREEDTLEIRQKVASIEGKGGFIDAHDFGAAVPDQEAITAYVMSQIPIITDPNDIRNGTKVKNLYDGNLWILTNTPDTEPPTFDWANDGPDNIGIADEDGTLGVVAGGGDVHVDPETGKMYVPGLISAGESLADQVEGYGRNLFDVFAITTGTTAQKIAAAMAEIRRRCNNSGEIDSSGIPDFTGIKVGDYIDGLDLSGIAAPTGGTAPGAWNDTYKNNRMVVSGFNTYKSSGDTENTKNHILFTFRNIVAKARMNAADNNAGGYPATEFRAWLEGASGDGSGAFATGLKTALGGNFLYTIRKAHSIKSSQAWGNFTVFPPSELEVYGYPTYGDEGVYIPAVTSPTIAARAGWNTNVQFPIYAKAFTYRIKRYNGARDWWWEATPYAAAASYFCGVLHIGLANYNVASAVGGCAPAFCVA